MSSCGLFMRKLPLGRAQVTRYLTPQTDFCSLVLLPFLFLPPGCGADSQGRGNGEEMVCPQTLLQRHRGQSCPQTLLQRHRGLSCPHLPLFPTLPCSGILSAASLESLMPTGAAGLMLFPVQPISLPCACGYGPVLCNDTSFFFPC